MRRLLLSTAALLLSAQVTFSLPAMADYLAAEAALQAGNIATAIPLLDEEAKLGNPVAAFNLAKIYETGAAGTPDFTLAATYYRIAGEIDTAPRYNGAALGAQGPQLIAAAQMYGQFALGKLYETGKGVPQDYNEALGWYTRSADLGNPKAMLKLAVIKRDGLPGIAPDVVASTSWLQRAAETGNIAAMNELGRAYLRGVGVVPNQQEAAKWFEQAAAGGSVAAEYNLGLLYKNGIGGQPDYVRAVQHFQNGANAQDPASMLALGDLYAGGQGLPRDPVQAHAWYRLAADYGAPEGTAKAAGLAGTMTPQDIAAANSLHDSWQPQAKQAALPAAATPAVAPAATAPAPDLPPLFEEAAPAAAPVVTAPAPAIITPAPATPAATTEVPVLLGPAEIPLPASTPATAPITAPLLPGETQPVAQPFEPVGMPSNTSGN